MELWIRQRYYCTNLVGACRHAKADRPFSSTEFLRYGGMCRDRDNDGCGQPLKPGGPIDLRPRWVAIGSAGILAVSILSWAVRAVFFPGPLENVNFAAQESEAADDIGRLGIEVVRDGATERTATVEYVAIEGSAKEGQDYDATKGRLTFAPGDRRKTLSVTLLTDASFQKSRRHFSVVLLNVIGEPRHLVYIAPRQAVRLDASVAEQSIRAASVVAKDIADLVVRKRVLDQLLSASRSSAGEFDEYQRSLAAVNGNLTRAREAYLQMLRDLQAQQPATVMGAMDRVAGELQVKSFEQQAAAVKIMKRHFTELLNRRIDMDRWAQELSVVVPRLGPDARSPST